MSFHQMNIASLRKAFERKPPSLETTDATGRTAAMQIVHILEDMAREIDTLKQKVTNLENR